MNHRTGKDDDAPPQVVLTNGWWVVPWLWLGALAGAGVGWLIGYFTYTPSSAPLAPASARENATLGAFVGVWIGALLGFGGFWIWRRVRDDPHRKRLRGY